MRPLILIGFMGSGKSAVARRLKTQLGLPRVDLDKNIEALAGKRIPRIFAEDGEEIFRQLETRALCEALSETQIVATGGGVVTREENRKVLRESAKSGAMIVYLRAGAQALSQRIRQQPGARPLIDGDGVLDDATTLDKVQKLLEEREDWYYDVATAMVETDDLTITQTAAAVRYLYQEGIS